MKQRKIALGPGAASLILIVVVLSMCVLCMLTLISAKNDASLSQRSAEMVETVYGLNARSEESLAALDAVLAECAAQAEDHTAYLALVEAQLPPEMFLDQEIVYWTETDGNGARQLECAVQIMPLGEMPRAIWVQHYLMVGTEDIWN